MTNARSMHQRANQTGRRRWLDSLCAAALLLLTGCVGDLFHRTASADSKNGGFFPWELEREPMTLSEARAELDKAKELYGQKKYPEAKKAFYALLRARKIPPVIAEEALYFEAECEREQKHFPAAADIYLQLINTYPRNPFQKQTLQHLFDIAYGWLDETRDVMEAQKEYKAGKRMMAPSVSLVHFEQGKPLFDMQGRATAILEKIYLNDIDGPLGEVCLFYLGNINLYQENWDEADHFYSQILKYHANGKYAAQAMELSIVCKQMSVRGTEYDGRNIAEARELVHRAKTAFPELAAEKSDFLQRRLVSITLQQAEQDLGVAEFYRRTNHPGSAYFYYELVRRRYPGTDQAKRATQRMAELKDRAEREQNEEPSTWFRLPTLFAKKADPAAAQPKQPAPTPGVQIGPPQPQGQTPQGTPLPNQPPEQLPPPRPISGGSGYNQYAPTGYAPANGYPQSATGYPPANGAYAPPGTPYPPAPPYGNPYAPAGNPYYGNQPPAPVGTPTGVNRPANGWGP